MKKKNVVYLAGGVVLGFSYPVLRLMVPNDALAIGLACLFVVLLRVVVFLGFERD